MKFVKRFLIILIIPILLISTLVPVMAASGSASLSVSSSSVQVGSKVTVTLSVSMNPSFGACIYNVTASGNLRLVSGDSRYTMEATNSGQTSKSVTLTYEAVSTGNATISASISDAITWDNETVSVGSTSKTVTVKPKATTPPGGGGNNGGQTTPTETKSSNNYLSDLSVADGTLSPEFNKETTSYYIALPEGTTSMKVSATTADSKASVTGTGDISLEPGSNTVNIDVKAEDGSTKTYTIFATVMEKPLFTFESSGSTYGVISNVSQVDIPEGFVESTVTINENSAPCFVNDTLGLTLLYLSNEVGVQNLYIFDATNVSVYKYMVMKHKDIGFISLPLSKELLEQEGFNATEVELQGNVVQALQYAEDETIAKDLFIVYVVEPEGEKVLYSYDKAEDTLQRYYNSSSLSSGGLKALLKQHEADLKSKMMITNIFIGSSVVLLLLLFYMQMKIGKLKKIIKRSYDKQPMNENIVSSIIKEEADEKDEQ